jgi:hypothetical protein
MIKSPVVRILFWFFIGDTLAAAIQAGSVQLLLIAIVGSFIGCTWLCPLFLPEENSDKKL